MAGFGTFRLLPISKAQRILRSEKKLPSNEVAANCCETVFCTVRKVVSSKLLNGWFTKRKKLKEDYVEQITVCSEIGIVTSSVLG